MDIVHVHVYEELWYYCTCKKWDTHCLILNQHAII